MPPATSAILIALDRPVPASNWTAWAPDVTESLDAVDREDAPLRTLGLAASLLMWGCASVLAVWYL